MSSFPSFRERQRRLIKVYNDETRPQRNARQALEIAAKQCGCEIRYVDVAPEYAYGGAHAAKPSQPGEVLTLRRGEKTLPLDASDVERYITKAYDAFKPWDHRVPYVHERTFEIREV